MMRTLNRRVRHSSRTPVPAAVSRARAALFVIALAGISSCDRSPAAPAPAAAQTVTLSRVRIDGPTVVAPGDSPRYTAIAEYSDGTSKDVTATAQWQPNGPGYAIYFTGPGIAAPAQRGERSIAAIAEMVGRLTVMVLEPGTFKMTGVVSEIGVGTLSGATVEVLSGIGQGLQATSSSNGYSLYGVSGPLRVRASADGFAPQVQDVVVSGHDATQAFDLTPANPSADVAGLWTMSVSPSPGCRPDFPDSARGRSYAVRLIQNATRLQVKISSPTLRQYNPDTHSGTVLGSRVRLFFVGDTDDDGWSTPNFYDQLSPAETFGFNGTADGTVIGSEIRGQMKGDLVYWNGPTYAPAWYCRATNHAVTLRR